MWDVLCVSADVEHELFTHGVLVAVLCKDQKTDQGFKHTPNDPEKLDREYRGCPFSDGGYFGEYCYTDRVPEGQVELFGRLRLVNQLLTDINMNKH